MNTRRMSGGPVVLLIAAALTMTLAGCGDGARDVSPDGTVKLAPGTTDPAEEVASEGEPTPD